MAGCRSSKNTTGSQMPVRRRLPMFVGWVEFCETHPTSLFPRWRFGLVCSPFADRFVDPLSQFAIERFHIRGPIAWWRAREFGEPDGRLG